MTETRKLKVESLISKDGLTAIAKVLQKWTGTGWSQREAEWIAGGRETVSKRGKIAKRIRANYRKEYPDREKLPDQCIAELGNAANEHSLKGGTYLIEITDDLHGTVGRFGDSGSCFNSGGCNSHHLDAMSNSGEFSAARIYKANGERMARVWIFHAYDGAMVFFNAYGVTIYKAALMVGMVEKKQVRQVRFEHECGEDYLYVNTPQCYAIGGGDNSISYETDIDSDGEHYNTHCENCGDGIHTEWGEYHYDENSGYDYCQHCFDRLFSQCCECSEYVRDNDTVTVEDAHGRNVTICDDCAINHTQTCEECGDDYHDDAITWIDTDDGDDYAVCTNCIKDLDTCGDCDKYLVVGNDSHEVIVRTSWPPNSNDWHREDICDDCLGNYSACPGFCDSFFEGDGDHELCPKCNNSLRAGYMKNWRAKKSHTDRLPGESGGHCTACNQYFSVSEYFNDKFLCMECQDLIDKYIGDDNCSNCGGYCPSGTLDSGLCSDCETFRLQNTALNTALDDVQDMKGTGTDAPHNDHLWPAGKALNAQTAGDFLRVLDRPCLAYCGPGSRAGDDLHTCHTCILKTLKMPAGTEKNCDHCGAWCPGGLLASTSGKCSCRSCYDVYENDRAKRERAERIAADIYTNNRNQTVPF